MLHDDYHSITQQCDIDEEEVYDSSSFKISPDGLQGTDLRDIVMSIIDVKKATSSDPTATSNPFSYNSKVQKQNYYNSMIEETYSMIEET